MIKSKLSVGCGMTLLVFSGCESRVNKPNVVVISIDTFRADYVGKKDSMGRSLTPNLDWFASHSTVFTHAYAQANETLFSHTSLFTGVLPSTLGTLDYVQYRIPSDQMTLAGEMRQRGYTAHAVVAGGHLDPMFGLDSGFESYQSVGDFSSFFHTFPVAQKTIETLVTQDKPFFLFWHGYDCHSPYVKPPFADRLLTPDYEGPFLELSRQPLTYERLANGQYFPDFFPTTVTSEGREFVDVVMFDELSTPNANAVSLTTDDVAYLKGTYAASVVYMDWYLGRMFQELERHSLLHNSIIVVLSDHGEDLMEHGFFNHRQSLHNSNVHVPLMVMVPNRTASVIDRPVALQDLGRSLEWLLKGSEVTSIPATKPHWFTSSRDVVLSESMTGQRSITDGQVRLLVDQQHLDAASAQPVSFEALDVFEQSVDWDDPRVQHLWSSWLAEYGADVP